MSSLAISAAEAIRTHLAHHTEALARQLDRLRTDQPDAVHQVRVAARRLRSGLQAFAPLLDGEQPRALRVELRWLADEVAAYRDTEVLLNRLRARLPRLPGELGAVARTAALPPMAARLEPARAGALATLDAPRTLALQAALQALAAAPPCTAAADRPAHKALPPLVTTAWRRLRRAADALAPETPIATWHAVRILAKRARYTAEALVPVLGRPARRQVRALTQLTELLGELQDAQIAIDALLPLAAHADVAGATAIGLLVGLELGDQASVQARFPAAWAAVRTRWPALTHPKN